MLKRILFQVHWLLGITLGTVLAFSAITGALIAFEPQLNAQFGPEGQRVVPAGAALSPARLYEAASAARPERRILSLGFSSDSAMPVRIQFGPDGSGGRGGEVGYADPYTGQLLPSTTALSESLKLVERLHRGMWGGEGIIGDIVRQTVSWAAVALLVMTLSGLYLRWPRGRAKWTWRAWFRIDFRLKGAAFLWSLHASLGTIVLLVLLFSAHTGLMTGHQLSWYQGGVQWLERALNVPADARRGRGREGSARHGPRDANPDAAADLERAWVAFRSQVPRTESVQVQLPASAAGTLIIRYVLPGAPATEARQLAFDPATPEGRELPVDTGADVTAPEGVMVAILKGRKPVHTGQRWGIAGQGLLMASSLTMPVFFVTGWMMYLKRRARQRVAVRRAA